MKIGDTKLPRWWWVPMSGVLALLAMGLAYVIVGWTGGLVPDADKARLPVERGTATLSQLDEAIRLNPDYLAAYVARARLHLAAGRIASASDDIDAAVRLEPGNETLLRLRAEIRSRKAGPSTSPAATSPR